MYLESVTIKVDEELKRRMEGVDENWSAYLRDAIRERVEREERWKAAKALLPKTPRVRKPREPKPAPRFKIVWAVAPHGAIATTTFPYKERAAAEAEAAKRGKGYTVTPLRQPMD